MADKEIPTYRCTSCLHPLTAEDRQHLFASYGTAPKSDDVENFIQEAQTILRYISAVADICDEAEQKGEDVVSNLHQLLGELADEANRRLELAGDAYQIVWEREEEAKKAPHARNEGRA